VKAFNHVPAPTWTTCTFAGLLCEAEICPRAPRETPERRPPPTAAARLPRWHKSCACLVGDVRRMLHARLMRSVSTRAGNERVTNLAPSTRASGWLRFDAAEWAAEGSTT